MPAWTSDPAAVAAVVVLILLVIAAIVWYVSKQGRSHRLKSYFGREEYDRTVRRLGDRHRAEVELEQRRRRVSRYLIRKPNESEADRFTAEWRATQANFVDDPQQAVHDADHLVESVMTACGYPMSDFESRAADISVDHPRVVENYRIAHDIAQRHARGDASTEDLRRALVHYRELFEDLLGRPAVDRNEVHR